MATIYDYLPQYAVVEPNNLKGLQAGLVVSQLNVKSGCTLVKTDNVTKAKMFENGHLCSITKYGIDICQEGMPLFLHYSEPLNKVFNSDRFFAVDLDAERPRLVQLFPGDEWMSTIDYFSDSAYTDVVSVIQDHVIKVENSSNALIAGDDAAWFDVDHLADDNVKAYHYIYIG